ncbi:cysteine peptidase family C39 domain-containing protein [Rosistilla oblonga]|nr:cysteine peptidase family C39 domain-containing protein [Rosistilla oblonga]
MATTTPSAPTTAAKDNALPRSCGPISLVAALRRFGIEQSVDAIWPAVTRKDPFGTRAARSYLLAALARTCQLDAAVLQCQPERAWQAIRTCHDADITVVLNHRAYRAPDEGHFTLLAAIDDATITVDDPFLGKNKQIDRQRFLKLWQPNRETAGHVLIAIDNPTTGQAEEASEDTTTCPRCAAPITLAPNRLFEPTEWNPNGLWQRFFCLGCDASFSPR